MKELAAARGGIVTVSLEENSLKTIKYAAFALTATAYVQLDSVKSRVQVTLRPKDVPGKMTARRLASLFLEGLKQEAIRSSLEDNNRKLREHIIGLALCPAKEEAPAQADAELSEEQQKELDRIIAEVEEEIKKEPLKSSRDPLEVTKTWEEKYGKSRCP